MYQLLDGRNKVSRRFRAAPDSCVHVAFRISGWPDGQALALEQKLVGPEGESLTGDTWQPADIAWDREPPHVLIPRTVELSCDLQYRVRALKAGTKVVTIGAVQTSKPSYRQHKRIWLLPSVEPAALPAARFWGLQDELEHYYDPDDDAE